MPQHIVTRFLLLLLPLATFLHVGAAPSLHQNEEPERPRPGLTTTLEHYSGEIPRLQPGPSVLTEPDLVADTPNGRLIYQTFANTESWQIYYQDPGQNPQLVVGGYATQNIQPRLDHSGTQLVYATAFNSDYELRKANIDSPYHPSSLSLTYNETDDVNADWSPDGRKIVFEAYRDGQPEVYVMNNDGGEQRRLTVHPDYDGMPAWSPDGSRIAFVSRRTGGYRIYSMNADGSYLKQISALPYSLHPSWSPDGSRIAFDADSDGDGWQELWLMNADGSNPQMLFRGGAETDAWAGGWSPDGRYLAFSYIQYIQYEGQWYWTKGSLIGWDSHNPDERVRLSEDDRAWNPDWGLLDRMAPAAFVHSLPTESPAHFEVAWHGTDQGGVARYDVQVQAGAGSGWADWLLQTPETSAVYQGDGGKTYAFRVRARDYAGNIGSWSARSEQTTVEALPPSSAVDTLSDFSPERLWVSWSGSDRGGSGIASYDVQYRTGAATTWTDWQMDTIETSALFTGEPGHTYYFRVRATDLGGNLEAWPGQGGDAQTMIYNARLSGLVHDNRGSAVSEAAVATEPAALDNFTTDAYGQYDVFLGTDATTYSSFWSKNGYGSTPPTQFQRESRNQQQIVLPPADDALINGNFESDLIAPWLGDFQLDNQVPHTGEQALYATQSVALTPAETVGESGPITPRFAVDQNGLVHVLWFNQNRFYYSNGNSAHGWSTPQPVSPPVVAPSNSDLVVGIDNAIHIVWAHYQEYGNGEIFYRRRDPDGTWSPSRNLSPNTGNSYSPLLLVGHKGALHVVWQEEGDRLYHRQQESSGDWSAPQWFAAGNPTDGMNMEFVAEVDSDGILHVLYVHDELWHRALRPGAEWSQPLSLTAGVQGEPQNLSLARDARGQLHLAWAQIRSGGGQPMAKWLYYSYLRAGGSWSTPQNMAGERSETPYPMVAAGRRATYIVAYEFGDLIFMERSADGTWTQPLTIGSGYSPQLVVDGHDALHLIWVEPVGIYGTWNVYYQHRPEHGSWSPKQTLYSAAGPFIPSMQNDADHGIHLFVHRESTNSALLYIGPAPASSNSENSVSQQVTIPSSMNVPTLSYYYRLGSTSQENNTTFDVWLQSGGNEDVLLETPPNATNWTHRYLDLSPWQGQTVTITFSLSQESNQPAAWLYIDDVSLGSAHANLWLELESNARTVEPGGEIIYTLTYGNESVDADDVQVGLTLPDGATLLETSAPPDSTTPLLWDVGQLAAGSGPHTLTVRVRVDDAIPSPTTLTASATISTSDPELEQDNNRAEVRTVGGWYTYLPQLQR